MQVFIDESGNHALAPIHVEVLYGVFVVGAVCFDEQEYAVFDEAFRALNCPYSDWTI